MPRAPMMTDAEVSALETRVRQNAAARLAGRLTELRPAEDAVYDEVRLVRTVDTEVRYSPSGNFVLTAATCANEACTEQICETSPEPFDPTEMCDWVILAGPNGKVTACCSEDCLLVVLAHRARTRALPAVTRPQRAWNGWTHEPGSAA